jgi:hypothetical protein
MVSVRAEAAATASDRLSYKFKSDEDQTDSENDDSELLDDSNDDNEEDRKPRAKENVPSREINPAPNGVSESQEANNVWLALYKKSVLACVAHINSIRVNTTNRNDMIAGGVANTPDRKFSHHDVSVSPETNHGYILEPCMPPLIPQWQMQQRRQSPRVSTQTRRFDKDYQGHISVVDWSDDDQYIGELAWTEEELSNDEDDDDVSPPAPKRCRRQGPCKKIIYDGIPYAKEGINWTGWTQQRFQRLVRWSHCLLAKCLSHTLCTGVMYFTYLWNLPTTQPVYS